jgi:hypothetical protein
MDRSLANLALDTIKGRHMFSKFWIVVTAIDLPTKAGGLLGPLDAVVAIGMVAMVSIDPFGGKETSIRRFSVSSWS